MDRSLPTNYKWHVVAMLWCISFFNYADRQAIFSVFPLLEREMQLTSVQLGLLGSAFAWVYGLGAPFAGWIVDRVKRRSAILGGLYAWSAICIATIFSWDFKHLLFWRAAEGLGETFYYPASMSLVSDYHDSRTRSRAMGLHQTSVYIGTIGGGFFAGLIGQYYGWRLSFIVFGGLGILLGLVLQRHLVEPPRGAADLAEAGGHGHAGRRTAALRRVPAAGRPHADAALPDGRVHVRELRRGGPAVVDAEVPLRQVPHGPGDGRAHGDRVRAARQHGRRATGRLAGGRLAPPVAARPARGADGGRARRRAVRGAVRDDAVDRAG